MAGERTGRRSPVQRAELHVTVLGAPSASWQGEAFDVPRRQVRALLFRLAATLRPVARERLCFLFWPDVPESAARRNLSRLVSHLRRALPDPTLLLTSGDCIRLDARRVSSDVVTFKRLSGHRSETEMLRRAADIYRGPFLAGVSLAGAPEFEAWALEQQRACEGRYLEVLAALVERLAERHQYDAAIVYARRYLTTDDLAEDIHRRLISFYAATGDRSAAQRQFERCAAVLERELGVRPLPTTRQVYLRALDGNERRSARRAPGLSWTTLPSLDVPLVGRKEPFEQLRGAWSSACDGQGRVVFISGEPGIGKSRLMKAFATRIGGRALVLAAAGRHGEQTLPYQPVAEILRSVPDWEALATPGQRVWLTEAARVLPELREIFPGLPRPLTTEPSEARTRLLEALCQLTMRLARGSRPLLICLDDLHRADGATFDWLFCLARHVAEERAEGCPILILGTYRVEDRDAIAELRRRLLRLDMLSEIQLRGLQRDAVLEIVRHLAAARPGVTVLSRRLHRATGGNPFFLLETLRALQEAGKLTGDLNALQEVPLPDSVRQAIEARLARLEPQARQVLEAGAILGAPFEFDLVRRTAGRGEMEAIDGLDAAVNRHLLIEGTSGYRFRHALIRQTVEKSLGPVRRHLLHRRAARALARIDPQAVLQIAHHFDLGGQKEKALGYYRRAAQEAKSLFAWSQVEEIQGRVLDLLDRLDPTRSNPELLALRGETLTSRAHMRFLQGRLEERDADLADLAALAKASDDRTLHLETIFHRVRYLNLGGQYEEAIAKSEEGLVLAQRMRDPAAESRLLAHIGFAHYFLGQPRAALLALESAMEASAEEMDLDKRGRITHIVGYVHYHLGDYPRALEYQREALECNRQIRDYNRAAWNLMDIGFLLLKLGHYAEAKERLGESLALARRIRAHPAEAYVTTLMGDWELYRGDYAAALELYQGSLAMQAEVRSKHGIVAAEDGAGFASYHLGNMDGAKRTLQHALEHAREIGHKRHIALALIGLGLVELVDSGPPVAHQPLREGLSVAQSSECPENIAMALAALARADRMQADYGSALNHALEAGQVADAHSLITCRAWADFEAGLTLLLQGKPEGALVHTSLAVEALPRTHEAWIGSEEIHQAHARVLQALGRVSEARAQTRLAEAVIQAKADSIPDPQRRQRYLQHVSPSRASAVD